MSLQDLVAGSSFIAAGIGCGVIGLLHRGSHAYDSTRKITVAKGNGLSAQISQRLPSYKKVSPVVDHVLWNIGGTLGFVGIEVNQHGSDAFYSGASAVVMLNALQDVLFTSRRSRDEGDLGQIVVDYAVPWMTAYALSQLVS